MHGMLGFAGLLALIALAFGSRAASVVAAIILILGSALMVLIIVVGFRDGWGL